MVLCRRDFIIYYPVALFEPENATFWPLFLSVCRHEFVKDGFEIVFFKEMGRLQCNFYRNLFVIFSCVPPSHLLTVHVTEGGWLSVAPLLRECIL